MSSDTKDHDSPREPGRVLIPREDLAERIPGLAGEVAGYCQGEDVLLLGLLQGCFVFLADLLRALPEEARPLVDFMHLSSYAEGVEPGSVALHQPPRLEVRKRRILVIDDILDTGRTLGYVRDYLLVERGASAVSFCVLLRKERERRPVVEADFVGFSIPDTFVVGYGLDYAGRFRNLPHISELA